MVDDAIRLLAEQRIKDALENGEFDNLPGKGRPLRFADTSLVPPDQRIAYKILSNAGMLPVEMDLKKEIIDLEQAARTAEGDEKHRLTRKLTEKTLQYNIIMDTRRRKK